MAPLAHLAVYKVCGDTFCKEIDLIAGIDAAIGDGVDVLSISIAGSSKPFYENAFDIATFKAARKGIFVSCSAGNQGPAESTISNRAPWYLTVAAGTMDRSIKAVVKLGDGQEFEGQTVFDQDKFPSTSLPLTFPIPFGIGAEETDNCNDDLKTLNPKDIVKKGEMVLCNALGSPPLGKYVQKLGGTAMILLNGETLGYTTFAEYRVLPASQVSYTDASKIFSYFNSSTKPTATIIFKGTIIGKSIEAPTVAYFSSRGPSKETPDVLKPDILGPGVNVLGAWIKPVGHDEKGSNVPYMKYFNFLSGTSMAAPHLSGIAALIKQKHPDWSPAAIKSAIMTTASTEDNNGSPIMDEQHHPASFFMMGAGHVNPQKAADPGLVFDIETEQYIAFLCGLGYNDKQVQIITGDMNTKCEDIQKISQSELNYPSIVLSSGKLTPPVIVNRTVTNVGEAMSTYQVEINMPNKVIVEVVPNVLKFHELNEKQSYQVRINSSSVVVSKKIMQGNLKWISDKYTVTTPIIIY
ncbi:hypothetical protein J5N97_027732 [Dioscorea zingiberensis]|uniref:Uncharacterized protein n=1 Tax=Dioscorea zingiberensis TaxID=325984 RepID=A0A9D5H422_9LILI|nr:hypothetical protein J5N97_027732 [Dioscorea zingiberensis]